MCAWQRYSSLYAAMYHALPCSRSVTCTNVRSLELVAKYRKGTSRPVRTRLLRCAPASYRQRKVGRRRIGGAGVNERARARRYSYTA